MSLSFYGPPVDIAPQDHPGGFVNLPLGTPDVAFPETHVQYVDPDPTNVAADRYIEILPGGGGIYYFQGTLYAQTPTFSTNPQKLLTIQPQVDLGSGWVTIIPYNVILTVQASTGGPRQFYAAAGTLQGTFYLPDGAKVRAIVLTAPDNLTIGLNSLGPLPISRDVALFMQRLVATNSL